MAFDRKQTNSRNKTTDVKHAKNTFTLLPYLTSDAQLIYLKFLKA